MDRKYIDDQHIAARYLAGQLSDSEREAFEASYVEHPELMRELEVAARLKVGLMGLRDAGELDLPSKRPARFPRTLQWAAAAAAVAVLAVSFVYFDRPSSPLLLAASPAAFLDGRGAALPVARTFTVLRARNGGYDAEIPAAASPATTELRIRTEFEPEPPAYRVTLSSVGDAGEKALLAEVRHLAATEDGYVHVFLGAVGSGTYNLILSGDEGTSAEESSTFVIRIQ